MKTKKYRHADLEKKRSIFFQVGMIVSLACVFVAFEWSSKESGLLPMSDEDIWVEPADIMPIVRIKEEPKPILMAPTKIITAPDEKVITEDGPEFSTEIIDIEQIVEVPPMQEEVIDETIHHIVERMPEFPGGEAALLKFVASNIKYPAICAEMCVQGRVYIAFVVNKDGSVSDVQVIRSPDANLSAEAMRVVKMMPQWKPGKQGGKPVNVSYNIPVSFRLQ